MCRRGRMTRSRFLRLNAPSPSRYLIASVPSLNRSPRVTAPKIRADPMIRAALTTPSEKAYRSSPSLQNDQSFPNSLIFRHFGNDLNAFQMNPEKNAVRVLTIPDVRMILDRPAQARRVPARQAPAMTDLDTPVQAQPARDKWGPGKVPAIPDDPMADTAA
jgi:hypothetical protein